MFDVLSDLPQGANATLLCNGDAHFRYDHKGSMLYKTWLVGESPVGNGELTPTKHGPMPGRELANPRELTGPAAGFPC